MSEEGEADFDAGQILEDAHDVQFSSEARASPRQERRPTAAAASIAPAAGEAVQGTAAGADVAPSSVAAEGSGEARYAYGSSERRGEYDARHGEALPPRSPEASRRAGDEDYYHCRGSGRSRSRSRHRSPSRDHARRGAPAEYSGEYRGGSYRVNRYGERELSRSGYYRRNERESTGYRRRDSERQPYSRSGYSARDEMEAGDASRRIVDKERAIEELRLRVRSATDRPVDIVPPTTRERNPSAAIRPSEDSLATQSHPASVQETLSTRAITGAVPPAATSEPTVDMDDIEEGEHIEVEGEIEVARPAKSDYIREKADVSMRNRSRSNSSYGRSRAAYANHSPSRGHSGKERSRSRTRAYHDPEDRRAGGGGSHEHPSDGAYRRKYDDQTDRSEYRSREPYGSRSAQYSKYGDASYQSSRYAASGRSPSDAREGGYRSERRYYSSRYDRYGTADSRTPTDSRYPALGSAVSPSRQPSRSRSRSPVTSRDDDRRADRAAYSDRHHHASRPMSRDAGSYSRSPSRYARDAGGADTGYSGAASERRRAHYGEARWPVPDNRSRSPPSHQTATDEAPLDGSDSTNPPPPPPPPPMQSNGSTHGPSSFGSHTRTDSPSYHQHSQDSPYRGYSSRQYHRQSRSSKAGVSSSRTPYASRHEYEGHSRSPSNGGSYQPSRGQSPGTGPSTSFPVAVAAAAAATEPPVQPELVLPPFSLGTDLYISRFPESAEWLEIRAQVREQAKRVLELASGSRKTEFEMTYAGWGVHKAEGQAQLALWQIERAEQGLGAASSHSLITASALNDL
ncbi:hypothetical protein GGF38_001029 [Coemansia sp. RSA 25]|nr:hypothetical protein GGF38_001029 [Coemansia sp. RSA 25]